MQEYTIRCINTGKVTTSRSNYLYHNSTHKFYIKKGEDDTAILPVACFLVEGGGRKIMVDLGMSSTEIADKYHHPGSVQEEGFKVTDQLRKLGVEPSEITDIIFTHLHWDHVYYLPEFTNAQLYVQRAEYEYAINPIPLYYKSYEDPRLDIEPRIRPQWDGREFHLLDGECEVFDGISVYPTPGHSVGHQNVVVHTKKGDYHLAGDLIFTLDNIKAIPEIGYEITPPSRFVDINQTWNSIVELKKRVAGPEFILCAHAPEMIDLCKPEVVLGE
ncbi:MAG: N-acyl homoserine lactonase family protein [Lachnospiraceae bacterium]|nr:N-acyl homoserine lactonase family protein [Lachnospiraceae bacterium]